MYVETWVENRRGFQGNISPFTEWHIVLEQLMRAQPGDQITVTLKLEHGTTIKLSGRAE